jgi:SPP1 family predicted phage head-tail adaptor
MPTDPNAVDFSKFRHRISVQQQTTSTDAGGGKVNTWAEIFSSWASVNPLTGHESYAWGQLMEESNYVIKIRYRAGVTAAMKIIWQSRTFDIQTVLDPSGLKRLLVLGCVERVGVGIV